MHNHHHHHDHSHTLDATSIKGNAFKIGIILNLAFVIVEVIAGFRFNSVALLTDAGHNLSDIGTLVLSLLAFTLAKRKATERFTYGLKKTTVLAALANAVILLLAVGVIGYESVRRLLEPESLHGEAVAWVAGVGILINGFSAYLFFRDKDKDLNVKGAYLHLLADALVSLGVVVAGVVIYFTQWFWIDAVLGLVIALVILAGTWSLLIDSFKLSVDAVPAGIKVSDIKELIERVENVKEVHHLHIWPLSTTENALTTHVTISDQLSFEQKMEVIREIKHDLEHHNIQHSTIEIESGQLICSSKHC